MPTHALFTNSHIPLVASKVQLSLVSIAAQKVCPALFRVKSEGGVVRGDDTGEGVDELKCPVVILKVVSSAAELKETSKPKKTKVFKA